MTPEEVRKHFKVVSGYRGNYSAHCPAHADSSASLSIGTGKNGRTLLKCFAGCTVDQITKKAGLKVSDLFATPPKRSESVAKPTSLYDEVVEELLTKERLAQAKRDIWAEVWDIADEAKECDRLIAKARAVVTALGPESGAAWDLAEKAAHLETMMNNAEAGAFERADAKWRARGEC